MARRTRRQSDAIDFSSSGIEFSASLGCLPRSECHRPIIYAHDHARGSGCGHITLYGVGVIDDACTSSIHTIQTVGQCITCAVHSEWVCSVHHTGIINCVLMY